MPRPTWRWLLFSFEGRIDRRTYFLWEQILAGGVVALLFMVGLLASRWRGDVHEPTRFGVGDTFIAAVALLVAAFWLWINSALFVKRIHDVGWSGLLLLAGLVMLTVADMAVQWIPWVPALVQVPIALAEFAALILLLVLTLRSSGPPNRFGAAPMRLAEVGGAVTAGPAPTWVAFAVDLLLALSIPVIAAVFLFRTLAFEPFVMSSGSMEPTLLVGDYFMVSKFSYGYCRFSTPFLPLPVEGRIWSAPPRRGDVAVFRLPRDPSVVYVKRIIGLPGDKVQVTDGRLILNGTEVPREPLDAFSDDEYGPVQSLHRYRETLPDGPSYEIAQEGTGGPLDNTVVFEVPPGHVFALGDQRSNSEDSRALRAVGYIPLENLIGRVEIRSLSLTMKSHPVDGAQWTGDIRWSRVLTEVH